MGCRCSHPARARPLRRSLAARHRPAGSYNPHTVHQRGRSAEASSARSDAKSRPARDRPPGSHQPYSWKANSLGRSRLTRRDTSRQPGDSVWSDLHAQAPHASAWRHLRRDRARRREPRSPPGAKGGRRMWLAPDRPEPQRQGRIRTDRARYRASSLSRAGTGSIATPQAIPTVLLGAHQSRRDGPRAPRGRQTMPEVPYAQPCAALAQAAQ